jgi:hypothetical protein
LTGQGFGHETAVVGAHGHVVGLSEFAGKRGRRKGLEAQ